MWAMAIPSVAFSNFVAQGDIDMGAFKLKTDHITESTTSHGTTFDAGINGVLSGLMGVVFGE